MPDATFASSQILLGWRQNGYVGRAPIAVCRHRLAES